MKDKSAPKTRDRVMYCPQCHKRIFDVAGYTREPVAIRIKCPHCKSVVSIKLPQAA